MVDFTVPLPLLFWALMEPSRKRVLKPLPGYRFAVKLTILGRHARDQAQLSPQSNQFWTVDSYHLAILSYPYFKSDGKQDEWLGNRSERMLREMGPGSHTVPSGQKLCGNTRSGWASRTWCLHVVRATAGAFWTYKLNQPWHILLCWAKSRHFCIKVLLSAVKIWHKVTY